MRLLCLDISTKAGWAILDRQIEDGPIALGPRGLVKNDLAAYKYGPYPKGYRLACEDIAHQLRNLIIDQKPDLVIVEESNQGQNRYTQKIIEWIHILVQQHWDRGLTQIPEPIYISTSIWKSTLGLKKPVDAKKNDALLKKAREMAATGAITLNAAKKQLGIRGKWNKKMLAVNHVNGLYDLGFKLKDNDTAEAMCLGLAYFAGAPHCDGIPGGDSDQ